MKSDMLKAILQIKYRMLQSKLFKDSFWAVFGNGFGNALMLLAGILIARFLGKDLYGEYGVVKTTMFYIASFATFGLGFTSTKYIASSIKENPACLKSIVRSSMMITLLFSGLIAGLLLIFAPLVAQFLEEDCLVFPLRALAIVIVFKAITTTQIGILSGFKDFQHIAYNSLGSGFVMLALCVPLTYFFGLKGSLLSLLLSQMFNAFINYFSVRNYIGVLSNQIRKSYTREMLKFSFPVALQESSFTICHWVAIMLLTKLSSMGELGLYTASVQWNSIILMIPTLLTNVVLSYLSSSANNEVQHKRNVRIMLLVNFVCTLIPFIVVYLLADVVASFYGPTFSAMSGVLRICTFSTIFEAVASVFKSNLLAKGRPWLLFSLRCLRDCFLVVVVYFMLMSTGGKDGAMMYSWAVLGASLLFLIAVVVSTIIIQKKEFL